MPFLFFWFNLFLRFGYIKTWVRKSRGLGGFCPRSLCLLFCGWMNDQDCFVILTSRWIRFIEMECLASHLIYDVNMWAVSITEESGPPRVLNFFPRIGVEMHDSNILRGDLHWERDSAHLYRRVSRDQKCISTHQTVAIKPWEMARSDNIQHMGRRKSEDPRRCYWVYSHITACYLSSSVGANFAERGVMF